MSDRIAESADTVRARLTQRLESVKAQLKTNAVTTVADLIRYDGVKQTGPDAALGFLSTLKREADALQALIDSVDEAVEHLREEIAERQRQYEADAPKRAAEAAEIEKRERHKSNAHTMSMAVWYVGQAKRNGHRPPDEHVARLRRPLDSGPWSWEQDKAFTLLREIDSRPWWPTEQKETDHE